jgi:hypothetical protein
MEPANSLEIYDKVRKLHGNVRVPGYMPDLVEYVLDNLEDLIEKLGFERPLIAYSNKGTHWAEYTAHTWNQPVITLIAKHHKKVDCKEESLTNSLVHELVHASLEKHGIICLLHKHDEDFVQELADKYSEGRYSSSDIKKEIEKKVKMFKKVEEFYLNWNENTPPNIEYEKFYEKWSI